MKSLVPILLLNSLLLFGLLGCSRHPTPDERINVMMKKYQIVPAVIKVKSGEIVEIDLSTSDVQHGFAIEQLDIKESVQPGRPAVFTFKAPAKGEYQITCSILCGPHHDDMRAKLVVE